jgi:micrococcal nuclease
VTGRFFASALTLLGLALGLAAMLSASDQSEAQDFPVRARLPQLAGDSAAATPSATAPAGATPVGLTSCTVTNVVDGDTIDVNGCADAGRIRLILVDTPEISPGECFGKQAREYTTQRLLNRQVGLEKDKTNTDRYDRFLRYVWVDAELFNERLVRDGYAAMGIYPPDIKYQSRIAVAQQEAKTNQRGLWPVCGGIGVPGTPTPVQSPTATPTPSPTPIGTATPTPTVGGSCAAASASITGLDKFGETVTVSGSGNMTGWYLISVRGNQRLDFPANFTLNGSVQVKSAVPQFSNSASQLWWTSANVWNNSDDDDAVLYNCAGQQVSYFDDGH